MCRINQIRKFVDGPSSAHVPDNSYSFLGIPKSGDSGTKGAHIIDQADVSGGWTTMHTSNIILVTRAGPVCTPMPRLLIAGYRSGLRQYMYCYTRSCIVLHSCKVRTLVIDGLDLNFELDLAPVATCKPDGETTPPR
jgi:hypothetical protein